MLQLPLLLKCSQALSCAFLRSGETRAESHAADLAAMSARSGHLQQPFGGVLQQLEAVEGGDVAEHRERVRERRRRLCVLQRSTALVAVLPQVASQHLRESVKHSVRSLEDALCAARCLRRTAGGCTAAGGRSCRIKSVYTTAHRCPHCCPNVRHSTAAALSPAGHPSGHGRVETPKNMRTD